MGVVVPLLVLEFASSSLAPPENAGSITAHSILQHVCSALYVVPLSSIAVAWHRKLLHGENFPDITYLRLDVRVWRYFIYLMILDLTVEIVFSISDVIAPIGMLGPVTAAILPLLAAFVAFLRLSVVLPGLALGHQSMSFRGAWDRTQGHTLHIFLATLICSLPLILIQASVTWPFVDIIAKPDMSVGYVLVLTISEVTNLLLGFVTLSLLSFLYRFFYEPQETEQPPQDAAL